MKNSDEKRRQLKELGWKRRDRTNGRNPPVHHERWVAPWDGVGYEPLPVSFERACKEAGL